MAENINNVRHEEIMGVKKMPARTTFEYESHLIIYLISSIVIHSFFFQCNFSKQMEMFSNFSCFPRKTDLPNFFVWGRGGGGGGRKGAAPPPPLFEATGRKNRQIQVACVFSSGEGG